ncbi:MAG: hypothetical protein ACFB6S_18500 [Geminicoccaceae bacterium]
MLDADPCDRSDGFVRNRGETVIERGARLRRAGKVRKKRIFADIDIDVECGRELETAGRDRVRNRLIGYFLAGADDK